MRSSFSVAFALPILGSLLGAPAAASSEVSAVVYEIGVDGLSCPFCAYGIEKQLGRIDGVATLETDIASGTVVVTMTDGAILEESRAREAVEAAGFTLRGFEALGDDSGNPGK